MLDLFGLLLGSWWVCVYDREPIAMCTCIPNTHLTKTPTATTTTTQKKNERQAIGEARSKQEEDRIILEEIATLKAKMGSQVRLFI